MLFLLQHVLDHITWFMTCAQGFEHTHTNLCCTLYAAVHGLTIVSYMD